MAFAIATFVISLLITFGAYWLLVVRPEESGRLAAMGRLQESRTRGAMLGVVIGEARLSSIPLLNRLLEHRQDLTGPIDRLLTESGLKLTVGGFLLMTVVGCSMQLGSIVGIADSMLLLMCIPNLIGVYLLMPVVKRELDSYLARLKSGEIRSARAHSAPEVR